VPRFRLRFEAAQVDGRAVKHVLDLRPARKSPTISLQLSSAVSR